jgi:hypothetical protein
VIGVAAVGGIESARAITGGAGRALVSGHIVWSSNCLRAWTSFLLSQRSTPPMTRRARTPPTTPPMIAPFGGPCFDVFWTAATEDVWAESARAVPEPVPDRVEELWAVMV